MIMDLKILRVVFCPILNTLSTFLLGLRLVTSLRSTRNSEEKRMDLHFLITGHTKISCDEKFGPVKKVLSKPDTTVPSDMMSVI